MVAFVVLAATLLIGPTTCALPLARGPEESFILPGVRSNLAYQPAYSLDAYAPAGEPRPAAVIIHGSSGNRSTHVDQLFPLLDKAGYAWFSVDYGSADDVRAAIQRRRRISFRLQLRRVVLLMARFFAWREEKQILLPHAGSG